MKHVNDPLLFSVLIILDLPSNLQIIAQSLTWSGLYSHASAQLYLLPHIMCNTNNPIPDCCVGSYKVQDRHLHGV